MIKMSELIEKIVNEDPENQLELWIEAGVKFGTIPIMEAPPELEFTIERFLAFQEALPPELRVREKYPGPHLFSLYAVPSDLFQSGVQTVQQRAYISVTLKPMSIGEKPGYEGVAESYLDTGWFQKNPICSLGMEMNQFGGSYAERVYKWSEHNGQAQGPDTPLDDIVKQLKGTLKTAMEYGEKIEVRV